MEKYYERHDLIGVLAPRAYYIPFEKQYEVFSPRRQSSRYTDLNGTWGFTPYESILDVADDFYLNEPKTTIPVPSCVQIHGYDQLAYVNTAFPFTYNPPFTPNINPTYHYTRKFDIAETQTKKYICFEGVDSCFYLYINNKFVGYAQVSHKLNEFDITDFVTKGENKMDVLVLKWCAGSYLECQDKMRYTGISWTFSPVVCIARDLRWGRVGETFGEDPYLIGVFASELVKGYQGEELSSDPEHVMATAKQKALLQLLNKHTLWATINSLKEF